MAFTEAHKRSLLKTLTYRFLIVVSNFVVSYVISGSFDLATKVAALSFVINTIIYFLHERFWNSIHWGKKKI